MKIVTDVNGLQLKKGQNVIVHQDEGSRLAKVVEPFPDSPTVIKPGFWVDIDFGDGPQGIPSYIIQIV